MVTIRENDYRNFKVYEIHFAQINNSKGIQVVGHFMDREKKTIDINHQIIIDFYSKDTAI